mmetsp:Transcript_17139/g.44562  ORF Transcript_17139/g.44562 Transcript_17139/m.44562 type:complete len:230 (-) Transcript_17139:169-858(-)
MIASSNDTLPSPFMSMSAHIASSIASSSLSTSFTACSSCIRVLGSHALNPVSMASLALSRSSTIASATDDTCMIFWRSSRRMRKATHFTTRRTMVSKRNRRDIHRHVERTIPRISLGIRFRLIGSAEGGDSTVSTRLSPVVSMPTTTVSTRPSPELSTGTTLTSPSSNALSGSDGHASSLLAANNADARGVGDPVRVTIGTRGPLARLAARGRVRSQCGVNNTAVKPCT